MVESPPIAALDWQPTTLGGYSRAKSLDLLNLFRKDLGEALLESLSLGRVASHCVEGSGASTESRSSDGGLEGSVAETGDGSHCEVNWPRTGLRPREHDGREEGKD